MHSASRLIEGFVRKPTVMEKIHVVAFVLDGSTLDLLSKKVLTNLLVMKSLVVDRGTKKLRSFCKLILIHVS